MDKSWCVRGFTQFHKVRCGRCCDTCNRQESCSVGLLSSMFYHFNVWCQPGRTFTDIAKPIRKRRRTSYKGGCVSANVCANVRLFVRRTTPPFCTMHQSLSQRRPADSLCETPLVQVLSHLGGLARPRLPHDDHHLKKKTRKRAN